MQFFSVPNKFTFNQEHLNHIKNFTAVKVGDQYSCHYSDGNFYATVSVGEVEKYLKYGEWIMVGADGKIIDLSHPFSKTPERTKG